MLIDTQKVKRILEETKDAQLVNDKTGDRLLDINNEGVNHGIKVMFYETLAEIMKIEAEL